MNTIETLESRTMMSVTLVGTELQITGNDNANVIRVSQNDPQTLRVEEDGVVTFFNDANVQTVKMDGGLGNDRLEMRTTSDLALTERATILGGEGNDTIIGGEGADSLDGGAGNDSMTGGIGADSITGAAGDDVMNGGDGNDNINGGVGNNTMNGQAGNDSLKAGAGKDVYDGGDGTDLADYSDRAAALGITLDDVANDGQSLGFELNNFGQLVRVSESDNVKQNVENVTTGSGDDSIIAGTLSIANVFSSGAGNDRLRGRNGADSLFGGDGNDSLIGAGSNDQLLGGNGNDLLVGGAASDIMHGDAGDDILTGGIGADQMFGDAGNDFLFAADTVIDLVVDGGSGSDFADSDANDILTSIELAD